MKRKFVVELVSFLLMSLFLYAAFSKWLAFGAYKNDIDNQPFPNWITPWIIYTLPPLEVIITLALMFERTRTIGLYASLILMSAFSIYTATVLLNFFDYIPCSCGGIVKDLSWTNHLILNLFFVSISVLGIILRKNKYSKDGPTKPLVISN